MLPLVPTQPHPVTPGHSPVQQGRFVVQGITCAACVLEIEALLKKVPGVVQAQIDAATQSLRLSWDPLLVSTAQFGAQLERSGYRILPSSDPALQEAEQREERKALWRLALALLCMMQVMMYSTPIYLTVPGELDPQSEALLRWAIWVLSIPVVMFSAGPFFSSAWRGLRHRQVNMDVAVVIGIVVALVAGTVATFDTGSVLRGEIYLDSLVMFISFILVGRYFEKVLRRRALGRIDGLLSDTPQTVTRLTGDGAAEVIAVADLRPGDRIRLTAGAPIPADARVLGHPIQVQEAMLTGESRPVLHQPGELVLAGSVNLQSVALLEVTLTGEKTQLAAMRRMIDAATMTKPRSMQNIDRLAPFFILAVLLVAALTCLVWWNTDPARALQATIAVLIVTCPCALYLASPLALLRSAGVLASRGVLVQRLEALEVLPETRTAVFDKTGTLTQDALEVTGLAVATGVSQGEALAAGAALAGFSEHPMARALVAYASLSRIEPAQVDHGSITESTGAGLQGLITSGPYAGKRVFLGSSKFCEVPANAPGHWSLHISVSTDGAEKPQWQLSLQLGEKVRPQAYAALHRLRHEGVDLVLLSGDHLEATRRIGEQLGISQVYATQDSQHKLAHLRSLQASGTKVLMVGDGMNDAASLAQADVSVVLGGASALAQSRADFVIQSEQLADLIWLREVAKKTRQVLRSNIAWALIYNLIAVPLAVMSTLPTWAAGLGMALSSVFVVGNSLRIKQKV